MGKKQTMDAAEVQRMCEVDVKSFVTAMAGKLTLTPEETAAAKAKSLAVKLDNPEIQNDLQPVLEIAVQASVWESRSELKGTWIKGSFMQVAENVIRYRRAKGGVAGGIRGILDALGWGKTQAYRAKVLVDTFEDKLLDMPVGISVGKLCELLDRQKMDKKQGKIFDPAEWLEQHESEVRDAKSAEALKEILGTVKAKKPTKAKNVETVMEKDPSWEEITVANISARVKRRDEPGLNDVVMKSLSDTQVEGLKNWLNAQEFLREEDETVRPPDTLELDPVQDAPETDAVTDTFQYLLERVKSTTGEGWTGHEPSPQVWATFGWTNELIDAAMDHWDDLEVEENKPQQPEVEFILEYSVLVRQAAEKILRAESGVDEYPDWEDVVQSVIPDDGCIDLSGAYGDRKGRVGYIVPTYEGLSLNAEPIRVIRDEEFAVTTKDWLSLTEPLFAAQPDCIGLTMYNEKGRFVVESRGNDGGIVETYWARPECPRSAASTPA